MRSKSTNLILLLTVGLLTLLANSGMVLSYFPIYLYILIPSAALINTLPILVKKPPFGKRLYFLIHGYYYLYIYIVSTILSIGYQLFLCLLFIQEFSYFYMVNLLICSGILAVTLYIGLTIICCTSTQLRLRLRLWGICLGLIPVINIIILVLILRKAKSEIRVESEKELRNQQRLPQQICKTKYPILLVHGIFFRDNGRFAYWGRIPEELRQNGATVFFGNQPSAASIPECARILTNRIKQIKKETGCEKVNIIAHSKGGLDCRYAMAFCGAAPHVASLTTVSTPHRGSPFADYLLNKISHKSQKRICYIYNKTLNKFGEPEADLITASRQLTTDYCISLDKRMPPPKGVFCQSIGSTLIKPRKGHFPINITGFVMANITQANDGLVCEDSFAWGERYTLINPDSPIGVSHSDVTDLFRINHPDFDVREFYVQLVADLKAKEL